MAYTDDYVKTNWVNKPSTNTPINQTNLNHLEQGVKNNCGRVANLSTTKAEQSDLLSTFKGVAFDSTTGTFTFTKWDGTSVTVNTDLEKIAVNFDYDDDPTSAHYQNLVITLDDGTVKYVDMSALITEYEFTSTTTIAFTVGADGKVSANIPDGSITGNKLQPNYLADCQQAKTNAETAAGAAETDALDAEAWANGTRGGVPIPPTDPAYQKYSKWWAEHGANSLAGLTDVNITSPQNGDTLVYDSATQKWINVAAGPTPVTVTLTLNGAKNDVITIKDSNDQTVGTCTFAAGQTSGTVQIDVPVGGGSFKFISSVAKVKSGGSFVDYEKTVTLSDAVSQTVNVYPKNAFYWYGKDINNITHDGYSWDGATTYAANKGTNYVEFTQSNFQLMGTANAIDFTPFNKLHFIVESDVSINTTGGGLNTTKTSISAGGNLSKYADFPGSNNAKADVELDVTSINQSAYIFMVDGSSTAHSCKVYAIFGDDGHEDDITINGAKEDTITIKDSDNQTVATCIFGSGKTVGYVSKALLPNGTYKFVSSVAKGITEETKYDDYEKTITLDGSESEVNVYHSGALYWYGNYVKTMVPSSNVHSSAGVDTRITPTVTDLTNSFNVQINTGSNSNGGSLQFTEAINFTNVNAVKVNGSCTRSGSAYSQPWIVNTLSNGSTRLTSVVNMDGTGIFTLDTTSITNNNYFVLGVRGTQSGPVNATVNAIWQE